MKFVQSLLAASLTALAFAPGVQAAVTAAEASKLGDVLTIVGAERAGSADGSIPPYTGGLTTPPASFKAGDSIRPNPFAGEKPVLTITKANVEQYKNQLTAVMAAATRTGALMYTRPIAPRRCRKTFWPTP